MALHSIRRCPHASIFKIQASNHLELQTNAVKHQQKGAALYLKVERYSLHADDLNTFHLICPSHAACDLHGPKQNSSYCWLHLETTATSHIIKLH